MPTTPKLVLTIHHPHTGIVLAVFPNTPTQHRPILSALATQDDTDQDIERFARFLRVRTEAAARSVVAADLRLLALIDELTGSLASLDDQVRRNVSGDLVAARALTQAARTIETENIGELSSSATPQGS